MLAQRITAAVPHANVTGAIAAQGDFEVKVNGHLVYSKQQKGDFPDEMSIVNVVTDVVSGKAPEPLP